LSRVFDHRVRIMKKFRTERDTMGNVRVPAGALYGAETQRAMENFQISNLKFQKRFIHTLCTIKLAAAKANLRLKLLDKK